MDDGWDVAMVETTIDGNPCDAYVKVCEKQWMMDVL